MPLPTQRVDPDMLDGPIWGAQGHQGVVLQACRFKDGSIAIGTAHIEQESPMMMMVLDMEGAMALAGYLLNAPEGPAN